MKPIIYTLEVCPNCIKLKDTLKNEGIEYEEIDMQLPDSITEMRINGCFAMEAPVLQIGDVFMESLSIFTNNKVNIDIIKEMIINEAD